MNIRIGDLRVGGDAPVAIIAEPCQEWPRGRTRQGYGQGSRGGVKFFAHRVVAEQFYGPISAGMCACHHCDNPSCINPRHLYVGTPSQNQHDSVERHRHYHASLTHCPSGHAYDAQNTMHARQRTGRMRKCKACHRIRMRAANEGNRERINARQRAYNARKKAERQCA